MTKKEKEKLNNIYSYIIDMLDEKDYKVTRLLFYGSKDFIVLHKEINLIILLCNIKKLFNTEFRYLLKEGIK